MQQLTSQRSWTSIISVITSPRSVTGGATGQAREREHRVTGNVTCQRVLLLACISLL